MTSWAHWTDQIFREARMNMNGFTSGTQARDGRTVNHDPEPWQAPWPSLRRYGRNFPTGDLNYFPRPEYAVLDNPILADFRKHKDDGDTGITAGGSYEHVPGTYATFAQRHLSQLEFYLVQIEDAEHIPGLTLIGLGVDSTPEQVIHARRVLEKLAALTGDEC